ncbi:MAG TPA: hypothetical protein PLY35_13170 [Thermotogota bacterium]|nr:hypothetical protein [Thermotogota bacterium]
MANKRIYQLDDIGTYTNIDDGDFLHISDTSDGNKDKKVTILNILKKILGNRAFGGSGAIVTADASSQTMSNKRIDNIRLNSATAMTTTGDVINKLTGWDGQATDINKLTGIQTTKTELSYLHGVTGSIQNQINNISNVIVTNIYHYGIDVTISGTGGYTISYSDLRNNAGLGSGYLINYTGIVISIYKKSATNTYIQQNPDETSDRVTITKTTHPSSGQAMLDKISFKYNDGDNILISIIYRAIPVTGA